MTSLNYIKKFAKLLKNFAFSDRSQPSSTQAILISHFSVLEKIISTNFSKSNSCEYLASFKQYSNKTVAGRILLLDSLTNAKLKTLAERSQNSTEFKHAFDSSEVNTISTFLFKINLDINMFDKWINDLHHTICRRFLLDTPEYSAPQAHFKRLLMMIDSINLGINTDSIEPSSPLLASVQNLVQTLAAEKNMQLSSIFESTNLPEVAEKIRKLLSASTFRFSECLLPLVPLIKELEQQNTPSLDFNQIRQEILKLLRSSKENFLLDKESLAQLKIEMQNIVVKYTFSLCIYCMIIEDIKILGIQSTTKEVHHLLPNDLVMLLDLTGVDEIFAEYVQMQNSSELEASLKLEQTKDEIAPSEASQQSADIKKVVIHTAAPIPLKVSKPPKTIQLPTKQDFQTTKTRVIRDLLQRLGFIWDRTTGSHDIYKHSSTNGQVVLPHSVEAIGTRKSIYNQAMSALR